MEKDTEIYAHVQDMFYLTKMLSTPLLLSASLPLHPPVT
jgi:hypothetical protein